MKTVYSDELEIGRAIQNFLNNAVQFSKPAERVQLEVAAENSMEEWRED